MKKISFLLILSSFVLMIVSLIFVSAVPAENYDYGVIVFNEANFGAHVDSNVYAKIVHGAIQVDPSKTLYCSNNEQTNAKKGTFSQDELDEMYDYFKSFLNINIDYSMSKSALEDASMTFNIQLDENEIIFIKISSDTTNIKTKFTVNGAVVPDYSEIAGRVYWLYEGNSSLRLNSDCFFGILIAPDADVFVEGCGNYDGTIVCNNLTTSNEVHQIKRQEPETSTTTSITSISTSQTTVTTPETTPTTTTSVTTVTTPETTTTPTTTSATTTLTTPETTQPTTTYVTTTETTSETTSIITTYETTGTTPEATTTPETITIEDTNKVDVSSISDPENTTTLETVEIDKDEIPTTSNPKTSQGNKFILILSFSMLLSGGALLIYRVVKE